MVDDHHKIRDMRLRGGLRKTPKKTEHPDDVVHQILENEPDEEMDAFIERRRALTAKAIRRAKRKGLADPQALIRNPIAIAARKDVITAFLKEVPNLKRCARCGGADVTYRKDRSVKIFRMPLGKKQKDGQHNPLIHLN